MFRSFAQGITAVRGSVPGRTARLPSLSAHCLTPSGLPEPKGSSSTRAGVIAFGDRGGQPEQLVSREAHRDSRTAEVDRLPAEQTSWSPAKDSPR